MVERTKDIHIRATPEEIEQIRQRMEEAGIQSMTAYLIRMSLHGYVLRMDLSDLKEVLRLLQRTGNNLNQYAKKANETGSILHSFVGNLPVNLFMNQFSHSLPSDCLPFSSNPQSYSLFLLLSTPSTPLIVEEAT